jgi:hypothetical protein
MMMLLSGSGREPLVQFLAIGLLAITHLENARNLFRCNRATSVGRVDSINTKSPRMALSMGFKVDYKYLILINYLK